MFVGFWAEFLQHSEYFLRIIIAAVCGAIIGYERKNRLKEAGIRTHLIVALGSALMMVVSKYGFEDTVAQLGRADGSRIASQIVTGVGFLGAGTIFVRKNTISGLTTAAGIWTTAGIGMAIGAGLYGVGIASAVAIIIVQFVFHGHIKFFQTPSAELLVFRITDNDGTFDYIRKKLSEEGIDVLSVRMDKSSSGVINLDIYAKFPLNYNRENLIDMFADNEKIKTLEY